MAETGASVISSGISSGNVVLIGSLCALILGVIWWRTLGSTKSQPGGSNPIAVLDRSGSTVKFPTAPPDVLIKSGLTPPASPVVVDDIPRWAPPDEAQHPLEEPPPPRLLSRQKSKLLRGPSPSQLRLIHAVARGYLARKGVKKLRADLQYRSHIVREIVDTEQRYVDGLAHLRKDYVEPLRDLSSGSRALLNMEEIQAIFSSIDVLHRVNTELLNGLKDRMVNWTHRTKIGDVFLTLAPFLKSYASYVNNYNRAMTTLSEVRRRRNFAVFMKTANQHAPGGLELPSLLITPVQRLARYPLLLGDLIKHTHPDHPDHAQLSEALAKLKEIAARVNEDKRDAENVVRVLEIQDAIEDLDVELVAPHRRLVAEETVRMVPADAQPMAVTAFLFTDVLVLARASKPGCYQTIGRVEMRTATAATHHSLLSNYFCVRDGDWVYILTVADEAARTRWVTLLHKVIAALQAGICPPAPRPRSASQAGLFRPFRSAKTDPIRWEQFQRLLSCAKCGVISKQGKLAKGWHHRWMYIAEDSVRLVSSVKDLKDGRVFSLVDVKINAAPATVERHEQVFLLAVHRHAGAAASTDADHVLLCAESAGEKAEWVEAVDRGMRQARRRYIVTV